MKLNDNTTIIIGPPGTGKTGELIRRATSAIQSGTNPEYVGYISFTRQAVREARQRIIDSTGYKAEKFIGFRTLHSTLFWILGLQASAIVDMQLGRELDEEETNASHERTKVYQYIYGYHRVVGVSLEEAWEKCHTDYCGTELDFWKWLVSYRNYKKATHKIDFHDLVDEFTKRQVQFPFDYLFVDEAQDFTPSQWAAVHLLAISSRNLVVAGDSDQNIFSWSGADSRIFDQLEGERIQLQQSYRVPKYPHIVASRILQHMGRKVEYQPVTTDGAVYGLNGPYEAADLPYTNGETWYILCRNQHLLKQVRNNLYIRGIYYRELSVAGWNHSQDKYMARIQWYQRALAGESLSKRRVEKVKEIVGDLDRHIKLQTPWPKAFTAWPFDRINYYAQTQDQWNNCKVFIGTFHSAKGGEADNVVLYGDATKRVRDAYDRNDPDEFKLLYVAVTRTKNRLYLVLPSGKDAVPWHKFYGVLPDDLHNNMLNTPPTLRERYCVQNRT